MYRLVGRTALLEGSRRRRSRSRSLRVWASGHRRLDMLEGLAIESRFVFEEEPRLMWMLVAVTLLWTKSITGPGKPSSLVGVGPE